MRRISPLHPWYFRAPKNPVWIWLKNAGVNKKDVHWALRKASQQNFPLRKLTILVSKYYSFTFGHWMRRVVGSRFPPTPQSLAKYVTLQKKGKSFPESPVFLVFTGDNKEDCLYDIVAMHCKICGTKNTTLELFLCSETSK